MRTLTGNARLWLVLAGLNGAVAVGLGAYGAHGFDDAPEYLARSFNTGVQYHMWHALALVAVAWLANHTDGWLVRLAGMGFMVGIVLFCGTLYVFGATGNLPLRGLAPVGGISLMVAWLLVALAAWRGR
ncbi:MAG: DUF423 domain-containing protein [Rhodospirillales bacterium]|nr:DUF423 domain-containing protein [Rhodospirillales bacterium]